MRNFRISILYALTLWNATLLALVLLVFVLGGWFTLQRVVQERSISTVIRSVQVVASAIRAERHAIAARGEVEEERGATEQAVLRELRVGNLDIFITDDAVQMMAARRRRISADRVNASDIIEEASGQQVMLPEPVHVLLDDMQIGRDDEMARILTASNGVVARRVILQDGPARVALMRVVPEKYDDPDEPTLLITALLSETDDALLLKNVRNILLLAIPITLMISVLAGFAIARRSLAPLEEINTRTASISAANLDERLPVANPHDELGRLAQIINGLLEHVDQAFRTQRQFMADASHELRTPIAIIRGEADVTLRRLTRSEEEYREALVAIQQESVRLTRIVDDLFLLARVDAAGTIATREIVDMSELAVDAAKSVRSIASSHNISVATGTARDPDIGPADTTTTGDAGLLHRLLINLLDNAIKHTPDGTTVRVTVDRDDDDVILRVHDEGPGVPESIRERVFDRFVHESHERKISSGTGTGLGLSIAQAIAEAHGGCIRLLPPTTNTPNDVTISSSPAASQGATFEVRLPAAAPLRNGIHDG